MFEPCSAENLESRANGALNSDPHLRSSPILGEGKNGILRCALNDTKGPTKGQGVLIRCSTLVRVGYGASD